MKFKNTKPSKKSLKKKKIAAEKKIANSGKKPQFPNIYRIITEGKLIFEAKAKIKSTNSKKILLGLYVILIGFLVILLSIVILKGLIYLKEFRDLNIRRQETMESIKLWQGVTEKYPGFKDAYFRLALLEYQLGDYKKSESYNIQALNLDPNYKDAINLQNLLQKK